MQGNDITVIIAAYNASATIQLAVESALAHTEVKEVIVVDDASSDDTAVFAKQAANYDSRFELIVFEENRGPSAARNAAIAATSAPMIAILDADDIFLPQRFTHLLSAQDWDLIADNIVFCRNFDQLASTSPELNEDISLNEISVALNLQQFVEGNISRRNRQRSELGFVKPVIRRGFLEQHGIRYKEDCRLGEDFLLYCECLIKGGRLKLNGSIGYSALVRDDSLSSGHSVDDLRTLSRHSADLSKSYGLSVDEVTALKLHTDSILRRIQHRDVLSVRREEGVLRGVLKASQNPRSFIDLINDKLNTRAVDKQTPRLLFNRDQLLKYAPSNEEKMVR